MERKQTAEPITMAVFPPLSLHEETPSKLSKQQRYKRS